MLEATKRPTPYGTRQLDPAMSPQFRDSLTEGWNSDAEYRRLSGLGDPM